MRYRWLSEAEAYSNDLLVSNTTMPLPYAAGIGLRLPHIRHVLQTHPPVAWFEVHAENYFGGGANLAALCAIREHYPISLHGVGMGLGSALPLDPNHIHAWRRLLEQIEPACISEHLCWNRTEDEHFNDLLPLPYREDALAWMVDQVSTAQDALGRRLLIENLSSYVGFTDDIIPEGEFLAELAHRSGCGILLDLNNLYVNEHNLGRDAWAAICALPVDAIAEIHIAGFEEGSDGLWIDSHGSEVRPAVWDLLARTLARIGPRPVLLERDTHLPSFAELQAEAAQAQTILDNTAVAVGTALTPAKALR